MNPRSLVQSFSLITEEGVGEDDGGSGACTAARPLECVTSLQWVL